MNYPFISVIIPCRNSEDTILACLSSLCKLDYPRDKHEIIFVDGMSADSTRKYLELSFSKSGMSGIKVICDVGYLKMINNYRLRVVSARNIGFAQAKGDYIAFTDSDCTFDKSWLLNSLKYFDDSKVACVGGANLIPETETPFAKAVGKIFASAYFLGAGAPTKILPKVIESRSHGSNAIYRKSALDQIMPIDESILEGEDVIMNQKLQRLGYKLLYVPDVIVYHHRRSTPKSFYNQMYRYGMAKRLIQEQGHRITLPQLGIGLFGVLGALPAMILSMLIFRSKNVSLALGIMLFAYSVGYWKELLKQ